MSQFAWFAIFNQCIFNLFVIHVLYCTDGKSRPAFWPEGWIRSELWLHVQTPDHWKQQRRQDQLLIQIRGRLLQQLVRQHGRHRLQGEDCLPERQESKTSDMGESGTAWMPRCLRFYGNTILFMRVEHQTSESRSAFAGLNESRHFLEEERKQAPSFFPHASSMLVVMEAALHTARSS